MTAIQYFNTHSDKNFIYVGTIYGSDNIEMTGTEVAEMFVELEPTAEMIDHPAYGGKDGFYEQSGNIHYRGNLVDECVFRLI